MRIYEEAVKDICHDPADHSRAGALKEFPGQRGQHGDSGMLEQWPVHPLGWMALFAAIIRVCLGSATVAGLTRQHHPALGGPLIGPNLMVLSVGAGSLMFFHVNRRFLAL